MAAPSVLLNDGHRMPAVGLGVWDHGAISGLSGEECAATVRAALDAGYRHMYVGSCGVW